MQRYYTNKRQTNLKRYSKTHKLHKCKITGIILCILLFGFYSFLSDKHKNPAFESILDLNEIERNESSNILQTETRESKKVAISTDKKNYMADWKLILVNPWHEISKDYEVNLISLGNGHAVDKRCYAELQKMMDDCRAAGLSPLICSSYRSREKQEKLFNNRVKNLIKQGYSLKDATKETEKRIAVPGTSEHHLGLAVDIVDMNYQHLNIEQEGTAVQQWLIQNSWKYGFILRYPTDKKDITGINYEPWHYRYVGKKAAKKIYKQGICFEEYLENLSD